MRRFLVCVSLFLAIIVGGAVIAEQSRWTDAVSSGVPRPDTSALITLPNGTLFDPAGFMFCGTFGPQPKDVVWLDLQRAGPIVDGT